ncbi:hypothetical protein HELRODRAFT_178087 [Helobdella robusta]|uniref:Endonuclease/exonuclease/phosphatase domain-containing protein n=1 Tax=Helobdella robusta TaxID=6412 RepID=T1FCP8_HELRO|nr:hypothetical protein HELRODRAFT_178087 [Helobdella robusta]ESN97303.1 hypothetical protein HELRODRAFT_178087 [Helobdella robusta]
MIKFWFDNHPRKKYTWKSHGDKVSNMSDCIKINRRFRNAVLQCKSYSGADFGSDHNPVVYKIKIKLKKIKSEVARKIWNFVSLSQNDEIKVKYNVEVRNRFQLLTEDVNKSKCEIYRDAFIESVRKVIPVKEQRIV